MNATIITVESFEQQANKLMQCNVNVKFKVTLHEQVRNTGTAPCSIKSYSLSHSWTLWRRVRWLKHAVPSWGRGGTAAAMAQNEQTTEDHSTLEQPFRVSRWSFQVQRRQQRQQRRSADTRAARLSSATTTTATTTTTTTTTFCFVRGPKMTCCRII